MKRITIAAILLAGSILPTRFALAQQKPGNDCSEHPNTFPVSPAKIEFNTGNLFKRIVITITNPTNNACNNWPDQY